jgi:hypothetical protein
VPKPRFYDQRGGCIIDTVNDIRADVGPVRASRARDLTVAGWAVDPRDEGIPARLWLQLAATDSPANGVIAEARRNVDRKDVAAHFSNPRFAGSGFALPIAVRALPAGDYVLTIIQQVGADVLVCQATARVVLE